MFTYDPENQKQYPGKEPSIFDFFPKGLDLKVEIPSNDDLVQLYKYKTELFWDNVSKSRKRGEAIPTSLFWERLCNELNLPYDDDTTTYIDKLLFAGMALMDERRIQAMTPEEREEHDSLIAFIHEDLDDPESVLNEAWEYAIEKVKSQSDEIELLNKIVFNNEEKEDDR